MNEENETRFEEPKQNQQNQQTKEGSANQNVSFCHEKSSEGD